MSDAFMDGAYDGDIKRQEMASDATIRDYFAVRVLAGTQSNAGLDHWTHEMHAEYAYKVADAMLKARNQ
ncbi:TPA: hypothetical protein ACKP17_000372 [Serratia marcescens]